MILGLKNSQPLHFFMSLSFIQRFLHPSNKTWNISAPGHQTEAGFFTSTDDMEQYVRSFSD